MKKISLLLEELEKQKGIEALAKTTGYDPSRAVKGLSSVEEENFC